MDYNCYEYENDQPEWESIYTDENAQSAIEESEQAFMDVFCSPDDRDLDETVDDDDAQDEGDISEWGDIDPQSGGGNEPSGPGSAV